MTEGGVRLPRNGYILTFLLPMFSTPTMLLILNVWTGEGVQFSLYTRILKLLLLVLGLLLKMLLLQNASIGEESVRLSLYTHILKLLFLVLGVLLKMLLSQNVWMGEEGVRLSVYTHILILLLPTFLDNVLSTLNKIVPSDKSCLSVKFNSLLKNL